jgi:hypothetical protein
MTADSTPSEEPTATVDREESVLDDVVAGGIFVALGLAFAIGARGYELGTAFRMGPGYVPFVLGGVLTLLGLGVIGVGLLRGRRVGSGVEALGLIPVLLASTFLAALADRRNSVVGAVVVAVGLTVACVLIFVMLLQLKLPLLGSALGG